MPTAITAPAQRPEKPKNRLFPNRAPYGAEAENHQLDRRAFLSGIPTIRQWLG
jgi:hypothetical protein